MKRKIVNFIYIILLLNFSKGWTVEKYPTTIKEIQSLKDINILINGLKQECITSTKDEGEKHTFLSNYRMRLVEMGVKVVPKLKKYLKDENELFRQYIIIALGYFKQKEVYDGLITILQSASSGYVRASAATALGYFGDKRAIPALEKALNDDFVETKNYAPECVLKFYIVRESAKSALFKLKGEQKKNQQKIYR